MSCSCERASLQRGGSAFFRLERVTAEMVESRNDRTSLDKLQIVYVMKKRVIVKCVELHYDCRHSSLSDLEYRVVGALFKTDLCNGSPFVLITPLKLFVVRFCFRQVQLFFSVRDGMCVSCAGAQNPSGVLAFLWFVLMLPTRLEVYFNLCSKLAGCTRYCC